MIEATGVILSRSGKTYFTEEHITSAREAERRLSLPRRPKYRIGPIPATAMPPFDAVGDRSADPAFGHRGGGHECATSLPVDVRLMELRIDLLEV